MGAWLVGETAGRPFPLPVLGRLSRAQSRMAAPSPFRREPSSIFRRLSEPSHFVPSCRGTAAASSTESGAGEPRIRAGALPFVGLRSLVATDWRRVSDRSFSLFIAPNRAASSAAVGNGIGFLKCLESYLVTVIPQRFARGRPNISVALQATGISPVAISITAHHSTAPCLCCQELVDAKLRGCEPDSAPLQCDRDKTLPPKGCSPADCLLCRAG
jgi:hypothetical protein